MMQHIQSLKDFRGEDIFNISLAALQYLQVDVA